MAPATVPFSMVDHGCRVSPEDVLGRFAAWDIPEAVQTVDIRDCMLYGLSVGFGSKPTSPGHLRFVYEKDISMIPSMAMTVAAPGFWFKDPALALDWPRLVNVAQSLKVFSIVTPPVQFRSSSSIIEVLDKGADKGAICTWERRIFRVDNDELFALVTSTVLLRGDGKERRVIRSGKPQHVLRSCPARKPDKIIPIETQPNSGLLYRLNGTLNPLHADPEIAAEAGFERPIMAGTATLGLVCSTLLEHFCDFRTERLSAIGGRLVSPLYPGETLQLHCYIDKSDNQLADFALVAPERDAVVVKDGHVMLSEHQSS